MQLPSVVAIEEELNSLVKHGNISVSVNADRPRTVRFRYSVMTSDAGLCSVEYKCLAECMEFESVLPSIAKLLLERHEEKTEH